MKRPIKVIFFLILLLAFFLRVFKLDGIPPSLSWDEASAGYNAWTVANYGRDEWGQFLPVVFTSFEVDMNPVWIYAISIPTKIFGLNEFTTRLPSAVFGVLNVVLLFYLARLIFKNDIFGLIAALSLAVSPFNLQFSRGAWEANSALLFFLLGLYLFLYSVYTEKLNKEQRGLYLILSSLSFGIDLFTYESTKVVLPPLIILLCLLFFKKLLKQKKAALASLAILSFFVLTILLNPALSGRARAAQSKISNDKVEKTQVYQSTHNYILGYCQAALEQYPIHFGSSFLFKTPDRIPRVSVPGIGEFYWVDAPFLILGLILLLLKRSKITLILLAWLILAPIPSSLTAESPQAHRALFLMGSMQLLIALGVGTLLLKIRKINLRVIAGLVYVIVLAIPVGIYLNYYYQSYAKDKSIDWQYGMKQVVEYVGNHPEYDQVYMTNTRAQPYIFFLYYLKIPLADFRNSVIYNTHHSEGQSLVDSFNRFHFNNWNPLNCPLNPDALCIVTANEYGGQFAPGSLNIKKVVDYPNGDPAFYIISSNPS